MPNQYALLTRNHCDYRLAVFDSSGLTFADAAFATQHRDGTMMRQAIALASLAGGTAVAVIAAWRCQRLHPAQPTTTATLSLDGHFEETTLNKEEAKPFFTGRPMTCAKLAIHAT